MELLLLSNFRALLFSMRFLILGSLFITVVHTASYCTPEQDCWPHPDVWHALNTSVNGHLVKIEPAGKPCYSGRSYIEQQCQSFITNSSSTLARSQYINTLQYTNWEMCGENNQCSLNHVASSISNYKHSTTCKQGALPHYALNSTSPEEIAMVIQFAQTHQIAFHIKNTGHDFAGRSTSPNSIAIWTHPFQKVEFLPTFQPGNCSPNNTTDHSNVFLLGAGVVWLTAYEAAQKHRVTLVGGSGASVGVAGGYLMGGGHSILSPVYGLAADNVLEFKIVLANGEHVVANACNAYQDLFWALRGGGGATFGVVTEVAVQSHPYLPSLPSATMEVNFKTTEAHREFLLEYARHAEHWANNGFGIYHTYYGVAMKSTFVFINPLITVEEQLVNQTIALLWQFLDDHANSFSNRTWASRVNHGYLDFYKNGGLDTNIDGGGINILLATRLIPDRLFQTEPSREELVDAFIEGFRRSLAEDSDDKMEQSALMTSNTPYRVKDEQHKTSIHPAFRNSLWLVYYRQTWIWDQEQHRSDNEIMRDTASRVSHAAQALRDISPDGATYLNEPDVLEPNWQQAFWGLDTYAQLKRIKQKYDPDNFFTCWKCVGWEEHNERYKCYKPYSLA